MASSGFGRLFIGYYRVLTASDADLAWTSSSVANATTVWGSNVFRGVHNVGNPVEADSGAPSTFSNAANPNPPAVVALSAAACIIAIFGKNNDATGWTQPSGYEDTSGNWSSAGDDASAGMAHLLNVTGSQNPGAWTTSGGASTDDGYVWTGALKPFVAAKASLPSERRTSRRSTLVRAW